jgi:hypothetical protein
MAVCHIVLREQRVDRFSLVDDNGSAIFADCPALTEKTGWSRRHVDL